MKKFYLFGLLLLSVLFTITLSSCSKDDNEEEETASVIGTWVCTSEVLTTSYSSEPITVNYNSNYDMVVVDGDNFTSYLYNPRIQIYQTTSGKFALVSGYYDPEDKKWIDSNNAAYTKDDTSKNFYYSDENYSTEFTIESVTSTQLILSYNYVSTTGDSEYTETAKMTFKRMD